MSTAAEQFSLAHRLVEGGKGDEAREVLRGALQAEPTHVESILLLGRIEAEARRHAEAEAVVRRGIELVPNSYALHVNLGVILSTQRREQEAEHEFREALRLNPSLVLARYNLSKAIKRLFRLDESIELLKQAVTLDPNFAAGHFDLANGLLDQGRGNEALDAFRAALALKPGDAMYSKNYLMALNYVMSDPAMVLAEHRAYGDAVIARRPPCRSHQNDRNPDRKLRVGILSGDLRQHSCSYFLEPLLAAMDRSAFEVICYCNHSTEDAVTARLRTQADGWRSVWKVATDAADEMIRSDQVDVLVECSGLTDQSRLDIMAAKPAPVQGTYLGYPNTTGLSTIDFRVVDSISDPPALPGVPGGSDMRCVERLARIDPCAWCYRPDRNAPPVSPPPFQERGHITFGSFNNLAKFSHAVVDLWARVLIRSPGTRLLLKNRWIGDAATAERVRKRFKACGVDPDRIEAAPYTDGVREHLAAYSRVDIQLDTFPYHGTTTTCESFWQGVPVVTLTGGVHAARVSSSLLHAVGLPELAPESPKGFVDAAVALAQDHQRLADIRSRLRGMMERSPLRDESAFARRFGSMVRSEFARWCAAPGRAG